MQELLRCFSRFEHALQACEIRFAVIALDLKNRLYLHHLALNIIFICLSREPILMSQCNRLP
jgi:hypothetical protein